VVVAAVLLAAGLVLAGRGAGASVPSSPRRAVGNVVYLGGAFIRVGGVARGRLAAVAAGGAGAVLAWNHRADGRVRALAASASRLYAGGQFGAWTTAGAAKFPTLETDGGGQAIAVIGGEVYLGGHFGNICPGGTHLDGAGRSVCTGAGTARRKLLSVDAASGRPTAWNPSANSALGVFAMAPTAGGSLVAGGDFTQVGGAAIRRLALFG